jgi:hypothetical protein
VCPVPWHFRSGDNVSWGRAAAASTGSRLRSAADHSRFAVMRQQLQSRLCQTKQTSNVIVFEHPFGRDIMAEFQTP